MDKDTFLNKYFKFMQSNYNKAYTLEEKQNFGILFDMFEDKKNKTIKLADLPMASGKSQFTLFYCNEKYKEDKNFSAVIVEKTIAECEDFCISLGLENESDSKKSKEELSLLYKGKRIVNTTTNSIYYMKDKSPNPSIFKAIALKGFNYNDCMKFSRAIDHESLEKNIKFLKTENITLNPLEGDYQMGMCSKCKKNCSVKIAQEQADKHRIIAVSHARLILANEKEEIKEKLLFYYDENKQIKERQLLIIDEKIKTVDIRTVDMNSVIKLKEYAETESFKELCNASKVDCSEDIKEIAKAFVELDQLRYRQNENKIPINTLRRFYISDEFEMVIAFHKMNLLETVKFLKDLFEYSDILVSEKYMTKSKEKREFTIYSYIDIAKYSNDFENTVLLDATAKSDIDYINSTFLSSQEITKNKKEINLFLPKTESNLSKSKLIYSKIGDKEYLTRMFAEINNLLANTDKKTLIVAYKTLGYDHDYKKYLEENIELNSKKDKIIHFGQYTTGVNHLSDYENIIFLGELRKAPVYYQAKILALGLEETRENMEKIQLNEFFIDVVQQIGRTSYRKSKVPNVYIFDRTEVLLHYINNLDEYFAVNKYIYDNKQMQGIEKSYDMTVRGSNTYSYYALRFMVNEIEKDVEETGMIQKEYTFKNKDIKKAIGYTSNKFGRDIVEPIQKVSSTKFLVYNSSKKIITLNLEQLKYAVR